MDKHREDMVAHLGEDSATVEAYDVFNCFKRAAKYGLEVEWFESFIVDVSRGVKPIQAAHDACLEWDC